MLYSQIIGKTLKEAPKDETSKNAQLLIRAGFIHKEMAGVYSYLPLGLKVLNNIIEIIRDEMLKIGGQEISLTGLQRSEPWKKTGRWDDEVLDVWFKTQLKNGGEIGLATTHEEPLTEMMISQIHSYKDLPVYPFQFQTKFRNELRAKSGLLRAREFLMKDLYSFCKTEQELDEFYEKAKQAYINIWNRIGIGKETFLTFAGGGSFSKYSHEFQTICDAGEDIIYLDKKKRLAVNKEVYNDEVLADLGLKKEELEEVKAIEVGNIFKQKTKFSEPLGLTFTDENGERKNVIAGAYGIGLGRAMGTVVELFADEKGLVWPESIAPAKIHLCGINLEDPQVKEAAETLYKTLVNQNVDVLFDDREGVTAGEKFSDADLIGIPYRAVISKRTQGKVELKKRTEDETKLLSLEEVILALKS